MQAYLDLDGNLRLGEPPLGVPSLCQMQVFVDLAGKLRRFDSAACEVHDRKFGTEKNITLIRASEGVWIQGCLDGPGVPRGPVSLPEGYENDLVLAFMTNQGQSPDSPPWGLLFYTQITLADAYKSFRSLGLPIPRSLLNDIADQDQPEASQASLSDPGGGTANLPSPSKEDTPEADPIPVKVVSAAYALRAQGKSVSIRAACDKAHVDRKHFTDAYPEAVQTVKMIAAPDSQPMRGSKKNGNIEAQEDDD